MARPSRNGVAERKVKTPRDLKPLVNDSKPIGRVPNGFNADETRFWQTIIKEHPRLKRTHRETVASLAKSLARAEHFDNVFRRRKVEFAEQGLDPMGVYLGDDGKRHPLFIELMNLEKHIRLLLADICATPASQKKFGYDAVEDEEAELDEIRESFFK